MSDGFRFFLRLALGASFLSAVADRFGLWGAFGQPGVAWGDFGHFVAYTAKLTRILPTMFAWAATVAEAGFGVMLISGWRVRLAATMSGALLTTFALSMVFAIGLKAPLNYSVFSAAAGAFVLGLSSPDRYSLDHLLRRARRGANLEAPAEDGG
jgi:uncharacterized membrane protein YphA (DoxX/SURF4 family)